MKQRCFITISIAMLFVITSFAQDSTQLTLWNNFNSHYEGKWNIRWNETVGTPASIFGYKSEASKKISEKLFQL